MAKITENAVLFSNANPTVQVFADKVDMKDEAGNAVNNTNGKPRKIILLKDATGKVYQPNEVHRPSLKTVEGMTQYLKGHMALPCAPRSGYDSYYNLDGPTNPKSPTKFDAWGTARNLLVYMQALYVKAAEGGETGENAQTVLGLLPEYMKVAHSQVADIIEAQKKKELTQKARAIDPDIDPDELAEFLAARRAKRAAAGGTVPAATVPAAAVTSDTAEGTDAEDTDGPDIPEESGETLEVAATADEGGEVTGDETAVDEPAADAEEVVAGDEI